MRKGVWGCGGGGGGYKGVSLLIAILHTSTNTPRQCTFKKMRISATLQERAVWVLKEADPTFQNVMDPDLTWARICEPFKEPRNRFPAWRAGTTTIFDVPAGQAKQAGIDSLNRFLGSLNVYKFGLWPLEDPDPHLDPETKKMVHTLLIFCRESLKIQQRYFLTFPVQ